MRSRFDRGAGQDPQKAFREFAPRMVPMGATGYVRDLGEKALDTVSVKDFGATGDGSTNDRAAIQSALDYIRDQGGGAVYVPRGTYIIDYPIQVWDDTTLYGDGQASLIKNTNTTAPETLAKVCVLFGSYAREDGDDITWYACNNVTKSDYSATFSAVVATTAAHAGNFAAGDVVLVRDNTGVGTAPLVDWRYIEINRVVSVDAATGIIELEEPIGYDVSGVYIGKQPGTNFYPSWPGPSTRHIVRNSVLRDLAFYSEENYWTQRTGFYKCKWENIFVERSLGLVYGNGFSHSIIDGVRGNFWYRAIEIATASSSTIIRNVVGAYRPRPDSSDAKWDDMWDKAELIAIHGGCRRMHLSDVILEAKGYPGAQVLRVDGEDNLIERLNVHAPRIEGSVVAFGAPNSTNLNKRNTVRNSNFSTDVVVEANPYLQAVPSDFDTLTPSTPHPAVWLRADDIAGSDGDAVTSWSGVGGRTGVATVYSAPVLKKNQINGHATVRFDGVDDYMAASYALASVNEVFVVCKGTAGVVIGGAGGTSVKLPYFDTGNVKATRGTVVSMGADDGNFHIYNFEVNDTGTDESVRDGTKTTSDLGSALPASLQIGADNGASFLAGDIAEIIVFSGELGATDRGTVDAYLAKRYGLTANFPAGTVTRPNGCDHYIYVYNNAGELEDPCVEGCRFYGPVATAAVKVASSTAYPYRVRIVGNYFEQKGSSGWYSLSGTSSTWGIRGNSSPTLSQVLMLQGTAYDGTAQKDAVWRRRKIWAFPVGSLREGDALRFKVTGSCAGATNTKLLRWTVGTTAGGSLETGGSVVRTTTTAVAFADRFDGELLVYIRGAASQESASVIRTHGVVQDVGGVATTVDNASVILRVSFDTYCTDATLVDSITVSTTSCVVERPYEIP